MLAKALESCPAIRAGGRQLPPAAQAASVASEPPSSAGLLFRAQAAGGAGGHCSARLWAPGRNESLIPSAEELRTGGLDARSRLLPSPLAEQQSNSGGVSAAAASGSRSALFGIALARGREASQGSHRGRQRRELLLRPSFPPLPPACSLPPGNRRIRTGQEGELSSRLWERA